jgi:hypothetical protein
LRRLADSIVFPSPLVISLLSRRHICKSLPDRIKRVRPIRVCVSLPWQDQDGEQLSMPVTRCACRRTTQWSRRSSNGLSTVTSTGRRNGRRGDSP